jgi:hypothetical protein
MDYPFIFERLNEEHERSEERPCLQIPLEEERRNIKNPNKDRGTEEGVILPDGNVSFVV